MMFAARYLTVALCFVAACGYGESGRFIKLKAVDPAGKPITKLRIVPANQLRMGYTDYPPLKPSTKLVPEPQPLRVENEDGTFDIPFYCLVYADGTCRYPVTTPTAMGGSEIALVFYPAQEAEITIRNGIGERRAGIVVFASDGLQNYSGGSREWTTTTNEKGIVSLRGLPPGDYIFGIRTPKSSYVQYAYLTIGTNKGDEAEVIIPPHKRNSGLGLLLGLQNRTSKIVAIDLPKRWKALNARQQGRVRKVVVEELRNVERIVSQNFYYADFLVDVAKVGKVDKALPGIQRLLPQFIAKSNTSPTKVKGVIFALAAIGENQVLPLLTSMATDSALDPFHRTWALLAIARIGTPESVETWVNLRDAARQQPGAPAAKEAYTHAERMIETLKLSLFQISDSDNGRWDVNPADAWVNNDYTKGTIDTIYARYVFKRDGDEWLMIDYNPKFYP